MKRFLFLPLIFYTQYVLAADFIFQDTECKVLIPVGDQVKVTNSDKSESTCVVVGEDASCIYKNLTSGQRQSKPTKYSVVDLEGFQIWTSAPPDNIKLLIDKKENRFFSGITAIVLEQGILLNKQCVGKIVQQVN